MHASARQLAECPSYMGIRPVSQAGQCSPPPRLNEQHERHVHVRAAEYSTIHGKGYERVARRDEILKIINKLINLKITTLIDGTYREFIKDY